jgi:hypothetical protein
MCQDCDCQKEPKNPIKLDIQTPDIDKEYIDYDPTAWVNIEMEEF